MPEAPRLWASQRELSASGVASPLRNPSLEPRGRPSALVHVNQHNPLRQNIYMHLIMYNKQHKQGQYGGFIQQYRPTHAAKEV